MRAGNTAPWNPLMLLEQMATAGGGGKTGTTWRNTGKEQGADSREPGPCPSAVLSSLYSSPCWQRLQEASWQRRKVVCRRTTLTNTRSQMLKSRLEVVSQKPNYQYSEVVLLDSSAITLHLPDTLALFLFS